ncbi:SusD/RagB family nutrient-binding outer membrane lipoprotein [Limibacter armeniacum]|uniref:SusD/RagB family nutrient-binding outer membrane lipoprotein n=1 Tax=Limibacter armeniacum TaxID=466084 RepID=UPI002FE53C2F
MANTVYNKFKVAAMAGMLLFGATGCNQDFEEMNIDPDQPSVVEPGFLLASAQKGLMDDMWDEWANGRFGLMYSQFWAQNSYTSESQYKARPSEDNNNWTAWYAGGLKDLQAAIDLNNEKIAANSFASEAEKAAAVNQNAAAEIMKACMFQLMTDIWGPIPYSEALTGNKTPKYDSQESIYMDLLVKLEEAYNSIDADAPAFSGDALYNGNAVAWQKFANSLRMRVAMRIADVKEDVAKENFAAAYNTGLYFTSNTDNALIAYTDAPHNNPLNEDRKTREDFAVSNTIVDQMLADNDPRLSVYAEPAASTGTFIGMIYGENENIANNLPVGAVSQPGTAVLQSSSPGMYMVAAEVDFLLAEAVQRGFIGGSAAAHFKQGILTSMDQWGVDKASATAYADAQVYDAANWKVSLGEQKWLALYMQGHQGWIEWRRLDFGILRLPKDGILIAGLNTIPTRRQYPIDEQTLNGNNYQSALTEIGGADKMDARVWWDVAEGTVVDYNY